MGIDILFLIIIISPLCILIHELGHAVVANLYKAKQIVINLGIGKKFFSLTICNIQMNIHGLFFIGGQISHEKNTAYSNSEIILISLAGPVANLLFASISYGLYILFLKTIFFIAMYFNLWLFIVNLIPFKIKANKSDGWIILQSLLNK